MFWGALSRCCPVPTESSLALHFAGDEEVEELRIPEKGAQGHGTLNGLGCPVPDSLLRRTATAQKALPQSCRLIDLQGASETLPT